MATKRSKSSQQISAVAAARYALHSSSQRGRPSPSKSTSPSNSSLLADANSAASPEIRIDESSPTQPRDSRQRVVSSASAAERNAKLRDRDSQHTSRTRSDSVSSSLSSSSSSSANSASASASASASGPESEVIPRQSSSGFSSSFSTSRSTTSLLSQRTKSYSSLSRSLYSANPANFAPPFYNRPPTPLPPSPSLTSLLRPTLSATPSRPTTPDDSDTESHPHQQQRTHSEIPSQSQSQSQSQLHPHLFRTTPSLAALSSCTTTTTSNTISSNTAHLSTLHPLPRTIPKVPTYEYYGFVLYLTSSLFFLGYILWSYLPSPFLHRLGIYYYPDRWWSLAVPAWIVVAVGFVYVLLAAYNAEVLTLKLGSLGAVVDEVGVVAVVDGETGRMVGRGRREDGWETGGRDRDRDMDRDRDRDRNKDGQWDWKEAWNHGTDAVLDVPVGGVCEVLYGGHGNT